MFKQKIFTVAKPSNYISRDLSWVRFNLRVLDQARNNDRNIFERLKFLAITSSNLDEFFQIRVGSLYNYIDYGKERVDYSGLREKPFRVKLLREVQDLYRQQTDYFLNEMMPEFAKNGFLIAKTNQLSEEEKQKVNHYFRHTVYPMLTPMMYDSFHSFPIMMNKLLTFGVVTRTPGASKSQQRLSFVQLPSNLPRFFEIEREDHIVFVAIEDIIRHNIDKLFRNVEVLSVNLFRITRNGDFSVEDSDDMEEKYIDEITRKLKSRKTGRVVRLETQSGFSDYMMKILTERWDIDDYNIFINDHLIDYTSLFQIIKHNEFKGELAVPPAPVKPLCLNGVEEIDLLEYLKTKDLLLHHPYNSIQPVIDLIEKSAEDPHVLAIKITIYRLAKDSRITNALLRAAENGKHVSVLFEVKARFDEENNIKEALRLQKAGCFVIYGFSNYKTHTKLCMIVRKEGDKVTRYVHMSSGNYNEDTARLYTDLGLLTTDDVYAHDINEFFNVITGHSLPTSYERLITAPGDMRQQLIELINKEAENAKKGLPSGIVIKVNSLQDKDSIDALYNASQAGVPIKLIVRGMCCLKAGMQGLSENIFVKSVVGEFLEHARIYYFQNGGDTLVYGGSADMMVRSFERRIESLFQIVDPFLKQQAIAILDYNLRDNVNSYILQQDDTYQKANANGAAPFDIHKEFYRMTKEDVWESKLF